MLFEIASAIATLFAIALFLAFLLRRYKHYLEPWDIHSILFIILFSHVH